MADTDIYDDQIRGGQIQDYINSRKDQYNFQRWLLDDLEEVTYLQNSLRGIMLDRETNQFVEIEGTRLMNDKGARILTETYLLSIIKNAKLSNLDDEEIRKLMYKNMHSLIRHIYVNMQKYEIKFENADMIISLFDTYLKTVLNRALFGGEQSRLVTTQKVISEERISAQREDEYNQKDGRDNKGLKGWSPI